MYDWANSVFSLVITSAIFPVYYEHLSQKTGLCNNLPGGQLQCVVDFWGIKMASSALYSYSLSAAFLIVALIIPFLSGIADAGNLRKKFMKFFCYVGCMSCGLLYFFTEEFFEWGVLFFILGMVGFTASIVFYNAFLPEIAGTDNVDKISARGFSLGYLGSSVLLVLILVFIKWNETAQFMEGTILIRYSFVVTGLWWFGFAQFTFLNLNEKHCLNTDCQQSALSGLKKLSLAWKYTSAHPLLKKYLLGYFFASMGLQTALYMATIYGSQILQLSSFKLILTILLTQLLGIFGAHVMAFLSGKIGNISGLRFCVLVWIGISVWAYFLKTETGFYIMAFMAGMMMGGMQSLFRSTYATLIAGRPTEYASFYSFYDVSEKVAIVFGTFAFGFVSDLTGNIRYSALMLSAFFLMCMLVLLRIKKNGVVTG
ncbi:MAG: hypothetical protein A3H98_08640 [Bacteroidetes bacterium RIFCSPLOWO2_02_FULL_36_8]|nr:MAG: hypothetical protein A3H98_08640 [Bacteroidetes bacterium RIFCSPLOWO2_02_FULL_36_8]OFY71042.1 MAG: hypothetical protein A3G23_12850 [Bacteroidetes bacterium RIFCSPLOWO2_12_FULL_37_12]